MNTAQIKYRGRAALLHLCLSFVIFLSVTLLMVYLYYPDVHFKINGGWQGLKIMIFIDLILGPMITFLIYSPMKQSRERIRDLAMVITMQILAFTYGLYTVYQQHPVLLVLYRGAIIESISHQTMQEDIPDADLTQFKLYRGLPLAVYIPELDDENDGLRDATEKFSYISQYQLGLKNEMDEQQSKKFAEIQAEHPEKSLNILRLVGSYKTLWSAVDEDFKEYGLIDTVDTIAKNKKTQTSGKSD